MVKDELKMAQRFMAAFQGKMDQIRLREAKQGDSSAFELGDAEKAMLLQINNLGMVEGVVGGIVTLALLRRVRTQFLRRLLKQREKVMSGGGVGGGGGSGSPFGGSGAGGAGGSGSSTHVRNSPFLSPQQQQQLQQPAMFGGAGAGAGGAPTQAQISALENAIRQRQRPFSMANVFGWALDVVVAFSMSVTISLIFTDRRKVMKTLSDLPLVEGRSKVSDEFCPEILLELDSLRKESQYNRELTDNPQSQYLQALMQFCNNCRRRQAYECKLREEQGLSRSDPVSVPPPGVPPTYQIEGTSSGTTDGDDFAGTDDFFNGNDWASSSADAFVTDREEGEEKRWK